MSASAFNILLLIFLFLHFHYYRKKKKEMGNCQAIDAATLVIQHPSGKTEKFYSSLSASQVMKMNPGHCVALLISTTVYPNKDIQNCSKNNNGDTKTNINNNQVRLTRIKLLKPNDTLLLGHVYRLITTQGSIKVATKITL